MVIIENISEIYFCQLLQIGAGVVLKRPLSARIFAAQISTLLRRTASITGFVIPTLELKLISLNPYSKMVTVEDRKPIRLTQLEFRLLYTLITNRGQVVPAEVIIERIWGYHDQGNRELIRSLISRLRKKIKPSVETSFIIETIPRVG